MSGRISFGHPLFNRLKIQPAHQKIPNKQENKETSEIRQCILQRETHLTVLVFYQVAILTPA